MRPHSPQALANWIELVSMGSPQSVTGLVPLLSLTDFGSEFEQLAFHVENQDAVNSATMLVDVSHGGVFTNDERQQPKIIPPRAERSQLIDKPNEFTFSALSIQTSGPTINIRWALLGRLRR